MAPPPDDPTVVELARAAASMTPVERETLLAIARESSAQELALDRERLAAEERDRRDVRDKHLAVMRYAFLLAGLGLAALAGIVFMLLCFDRGADVQTVVASVVGLLGAGGGGYALGARRRENGGTEP